ncbi:Variant-specific surface protein [Giardia duodenalis]|uniref:Variant-specific surface protein n=1 Tax=Giardia intestinalis TaxID=5741 RepID=V6TIW9_GIAIN|nr:Variant-specific surface protein [Giardia intestinalis]
MFCRLIVAGFVLQLAWAAPEAETCTEAEAGQAGKCLTSKCDVWINGKKYCSQCSKTDEYLVDGGCKAEAGTSGCQLKARAADGTCTQCGEGYFLHKNGCYKIGEAPGNLICADEASNPGARIAGVCTTCADGYYKKSNAVATADSCIACEDANCAKCGEAGKNKCTKCVDGYFVGAANDSPGSCIKCDAAATSGWTGVTGCAKCTKPATPGTVTCDECTSNYLKIEGQTTSCVNADACTGGYFPNDNVNGKKRCLPCGTAEHGGVTDCTACTPLQPAGKTTTVFVKCSTCGSNNKPNIAGTGCFTCSIGECSNCSENGVCEKCGSNKKVSPGKTSCIEKCPENSTDNPTGTCVCNSEYSSDSAGTSCVAASTNKSGLSTGAIAGISVAAVVVVAGLIGFLCWWFICRGKA